MKEADNGIGYFGKGWASFKGGKVPDGWLPPENSPDALQEWVDGFMSADAEYPEESETGTQALTRIAPTVSRRCKRGLTLVEIMIVLSILGIVSAIAFPTMMPIIRENRVKAETRKAVDMMKLARMTALRDNTTTTVSVSPKKISMTQATLDGKTKIVREAETEYSKIFFTMNYPSVQFASDGILKGSYPDVPTVIVTDGHNEYYIEVKPSGIARVTQSKDLP